MIHALYFLNKIFFQLNAKILFMSLVASFRMLSKVIQFREIQITLSTYKVQCSHLITLCVGSIGMHSVQ